jgi:hypothetical protein
MPGTVIEELALAPRHDEKLLSGPEETFVGVQPKGKVCADFLKSRSCLGREVLIQSS